VTTAGPGSTPYSAPLVHGEPVEVSRGVFVILDDRIRLVPNVGIVIGGERALVVDTGVGARNGRFVLDAARRLAGDRPLHLVITQMDPGHGFGAQAFKGAATIIYSRAQRDRLRRNAPDYAAAFTDLGPDVVAELQGLDLVEPDLTYDGELEIDLGGVRVLLQQWGPAHTADDQTVLVDDRVLFGGDLFQTRMFAILPYFPPFDTHFDGDRWLGALDDLIGLGTAVVVPGHGEVTHTVGIADVRDYLRFVRAETRRLHAAGVPLERATTVVEKQALARWASWEAPQWIGTATKAFYGELEGGQPA